MSARPSTNHLGKRLWEHELAERLPMFRSTSSKESFSDKTKSSRSSKKLNAATRRKSRLCKRRLTLRNHFIIQWNQNLTMRRDSGGKKSPSVNSFKSSVISSGLAHRSMLIHIRPSVERERSLKCASLSPWLNPLFQQLSKLLPSQ